MNKKDEEILNSNSKLLKLRQKITELKEFIIKTTSNTNGDKDVEGYFDSILDECDNMGEKIGKYLYKHVNRLE